MILNRERFVLIIALGVLVVAYSGVFGQLVDVWKTDPAYSHGFLIPVLSAFLVWRRRESLKGLSDRPSLTGVFFVLVGTISFVLGEVSGLNFLKEVSILFIVSGFVAGWWGIKILKEIRFPVLFLFFMIPLPFIVFNAVSFRLQVLAARSASGILEWLNIPVYRDGNIIILPHISLDVEKACSGIQSLMSLLAISVLMAYLLNYRGWKSWIFALSAIPIAVVTNIIRITGTGILSHHWGPAPAQGFLHAFSGWVLFIAALLILWAESRLMRTKEAGFYV
jgi:exosortase